VVCVGVCTNQSVFYSQTLAYLLCKSAEFVLIWYTIKRGDTKASPLFMAPPLENLKCGLRWSLYKPKCVLFANPCIFATRICGVRSNMVYDKKRRYQSISSFYGTALGESELWFALEFVQTKVCSIRKPLYICYANLRSSF